MEASDLAPGDWREWRRLRALHLKQRSWYQRDIAEALGVRVQRSVNSRQPPIPSLLGESGVRDLQEGHALINEEKVSDFPRSSGRARPDLWEGWELLPTPPRLLSPANSWHTSLLETARSSCPAGPWAELHPVRNGQAEVP